MLVVTIFGDAYLKWFTHGFVPVSLEYKENGFQSI